MIARLCTAAFVFAALSANAGAQHCPVEVEAYPLPGRQAGHLHVDEDAAGRRSQSRSTRFCTVGADERRICRGFLDHTGGHESAGGHFNPGGKEHGFNAPNGPHAGDMPNQYVGSDGTLRAQVLNTFVSLAEGENSVKGRALMVHGGADDYESQPSGKAGERLACAVVE